MLRTRVVETQDGRQAIEAPGFSYLPRFISNEESDELISYFARVRPLWEQRHRAGDSQRAAGHGRRLTRPVYWLGAWQFACLGYYAEPDHRENRCVRAEPFTDTMAAVLDRLRPVLARDHARDHARVASEVPNTCLLNYYGREVGRGVPRDHARLRMHRDGEVGPVVMFSIGQPGLLEFIDPERSDEPELSLWARHRSVAILSGPDFKDRLYHRVTKVRTGDTPRMAAQVENFELRRVSISFRHVPAELISEFGELPGEARDKVRDYVAELARHSPHFREQLAAE